STDVVIISEKTAEQFWPGQDPIGKRLKPGFSTSNAPWREEIGIVKDVRQNDFVAPPKRQLYFSYRELKNIRANALVVRTNIEPVSLGVPVRNAIWSVDRIKPSQTSTPWITSWHKRSHANASVCSC